MIIKNFADSDIIEAQAISHLVWGDLYTEESVELQNFIYKFMVEYYDLNRKYSFSIRDDGFKGFILAALKDDKNTAYDLFKLRVGNLEDKEQRMAFELYSYLEACGSAVKEAMTGDDVMLGLFVSIQRGCGGKLLERLVEACNANGKKNLYLWTDTTCDYGYYEKNNFKQIKEFRSSVKGQEIVTLIYKKGISEMRGA